MLPPKGTKEFIREDVNQSPENTTTGATKGRSVGVRLDPLAGIGALAISGLEPFITANPFVFAVAAAGPGASDSQAVHTQPVVRHERNGSCCYTVKG